MGTVYLATHDRLDRRVALKVLAPELASDKEFQARFIRESQIAASLEHPNVIPIYDANEVDGTLYIAMRYVAGSNLRGLIQEQGRLTTDRCAQVLRQVAGALDAAHEAGLVHRDVKPENILVSGSSANAYLCDFGIAKRASSRGVTRTGSFLGTVDYCAPEQIEGKSVDGHVDIYALGGVLFHCLSGRPPYVRDTDIAVIHAHLADPPPAVSTVRPDLPQAIDGVIVTAMAKNPDVRYATAGELARAFDEAIAPTATTVAVPAPTLRSRRRKSRSPIGRSSPPPLRRRKRSLSVGGGGEAAAHGRSQAPAW